MSYKIEDCTETSVHHAMIGETSVRLVLWTNLDHDGRFRVYINGVMVGFNQETYHRGWMEYIKACRILEAAKE